MDNQTKKTRMWETYLIRFNMYCIHMYSRHAWDKVVTHVGYKENKWHKWRKITVIYPLAHKTVAGAHILSIKMYLSSYSCIKLYLDHENHNIEENKSSDLSSYSAYALL